MITIYSVIIMLVSVFIWLKARHKRRFLMKPNHFNPYGVSVYTLRLYKFIEWCMIANIAVSLLHVLMMWIVASIEDNIQKTEFVFAIALCLLY